MTAIETKYLGPTTYKGSRIVATANGQRHVVPYRSEWDRELNHATAAQGLAKKLGWRGRWIGAGTQRGMAWVPANSEGFTI